jgi:hypothetical protein
MPALRRGLLAADLVCPTTSRRPVRNRFASGRNFEMDATGAVSAAVVTVPV